MSDFMLLPEETLTLVCIEAGIVATILLSLLSKAHNVLMTKGSFWKMLAVAYGVPEALQSSDGGEIHKWKELCLAHNPANPKNVLFLGHVDSGKSTLIGRLCLHMGSVSQNQMADYIKKSSDIGKSSFRYAWHCDKLLVERERGITISGRALNPLPKKFNLVFLDAPGHRDFIKNALRWVTKGNSIVLVVAAPFGEFEASSDREYGTLYQNLHLASLVSPSILIAINKIDSITVDESRYKEVVEQVKDYAKKIGISTERLKFVPISAWLSTNCYTDKTDALHILSSWYSGPSLLELIEKTRPSTDGIFRKYPINGKLRIIITKSFIKTDDKKKIVLGFVASGQVFPNSRLKIILPQKISHKFGSLFDGTVYVKNLQISSENVSVAYPHNFVGMELEFGILVTEKLMSELRKSIFINVEDSLSYDAQYKVKLEIQMFLNVASPVLAPGFELIILTHEQEARVKILTNETEPHLKKRKECGPGEWPPTKVSSRCVVTALVMYPIYLAPASVDLFASRFFVRHGRFICGSGEVLSVEPKAGS